MIETFQRIDDHTMSVVREFAQQYGYLHEVALTGEPHAPNKFEGFVAPSEFSELGNLKQPLIQRQ